MTNAPSEEIQVMKEIVSPHLHYYKATMRNLCPLINYNAEYVQSQNKI